MTTTSTPGLKSSGMLVGLVGRIETLKRAVRHKYGVLGSKLSKYETDRRAVTTAELRRCFHELKTMAEAWLIVEGYCNLPSRIQWNVEQLRAVDMTFRIDIDSLAEHIERLG